MSITQETQNEAHDQVKPDKKFRRIQILEILADKQMTADEILQEMYDRGYIKNLNVNNARPRLTELKKDGKIKAVDRRVGIITGNSMAVWKRVG